MTRYTKEKNKFLTELPHAQNAVCRIFEEKKHYWWTGYCE